MPLSEDVTQLLDQYDRGPDIIEQAVRGLSDEQLRKAGPPGRWSPLEVVAHLADCEILYADRITRLLGSDQVAMPVFDQDAVAARLPGNDRDPVTELGLIRAVRRHMGPLLRNVTDADLERVGIHSTDGPLSLLTLLQRISRHIPHHAGFIEQKRANL